MSSPDVVHDLHPYPAKFIGDIPAQALGLAPDAGLILDPFCGIGTTLVEGVRSGRAVLGVDLNPIATLVSSAKLSGWTPSDERLHGYHRARLLAAAIAGDAAKLGLARAEIPRIDHWFDPCAQHVLSGASAYLAELSEADPWRTRLAAAVSSIVVRASRQESDTRYAAIDKDLRSEAVVGWLGRAVDRVVDACWTLASEVGHSMDAQVVTSDATMLDGVLGGREVGAAIFSPPYPNAYEYWLYHKYRMYWLGFDPIAVRRQEIGARPYYSGTGTATEDDFGRQMLAVLRSVASALRADGIVLVVVGDSVIRGRQVDNSLVIIESATGAGLSLVGSSQRVIRATRRSFNLSVARAKSEHVLLFARS